MGTPSPKSVAVRLGKTSKVPVISQAMLEEYEHLMELFKLKEEDRRIIIELMEAGAAVEPGPLTARLDQHEYVSCSWEKLTKVLGKAKVKHLRSLIEPSVSKRLTVRRSDDCEFSATVF